MERLYIIKAENAGNLSVSLTFSDNTVQTVDIGEFIRRHPHPQYNKYLDPPAVQQVPRPPQVQPLHHRERQHRLGQELGLDFPRRAVARGGGSIMKRQRT